MNDEHNPHTQPAGPPPAAPGGGHDEEASSKKILCGVLAIVLGSLGIHKFILGYTSAGIIMLLVTLLSNVLGLFLCIPFLGATAMWIIGIIEGIIYLTKPAAEFRATYLDGRKEWF